MKSLLITQQFLCANYIEFEENTFNKYQAEIKEMTLLFQIVRYDWSKYNINLKKEYSLIYWGFLVGKSIIISSSQMLKLLIILQL